MRALPSVKRLYPLSRVPATARRNQEGTASPYSPASTSGAKVYVRRSGTLKPGQIRSAGCIVLALTLYLFTWPISHDLGAIPFLGLTGVSGVYCLIFRRWVLGTPYAVMLGVFGAYCMLSVLNWLPLSWTSGRSISLIPQQMASYVALPLFCAPTVDIFGWLQMRRMLRRTLLIALPVAWLGFGWCMGTELGMVPAYTRVTDLTDIMLFRYAVLVFLLGVGPQGLLRSTLLVLIMAVFADDMQSRMAVVAAVVLLLARDDLVYPLKRLAAYAFVIALGAACLIAPFFWLEIWHVYRDSGVRAVFWRDALDAVWDTHFLGVGFGTQSIHYRLAGLGGFALKDDVQQVQLIALHNSFYQALFRCGVPGFSAVTWWTIWMFRQVRGGKFLLIQLWLVVTVFISMCVNPSLESANFMLGDAFAISLLLTLGQSGIQRKSRYGTVVSAEALGPKLTEA